jgi:hypothetical protein
MLRSAFCNQTQRRLAGVVVAALAAVLLACASANKAAAATGPLPYGEVDNVINGVVYYSGSVPILSGWAVDGASVNMVGAAFPLNVRADVTWYKKPAICALCTTAVVGQASFTQTANLYRSDRVNQWGGPYHGFAIPLTPPAGLSFTSETVCVSTTGYYGAASLGCYAVVYQPIF